MYMLFLPFQSLVFGCISRTCSCNEIVTSLSANTVSLSETREPVMQSVKRGINNVRG